jgi:hypothetical protein
VRKSAGQSTHLRPDDYQRLGHEAGYEQMPRLAPYHSGPYSVAWILQDPGSPHTSGSGAQKSGEIGVYNRDETARFCMRALTEAGFNIAECLPLNALPGYGLKPTVAELKRGALFNEGILRLAGVRVVILAGGPAQRVPPMGDWTIIRAPHPSAQNRNLRPEAGPAFLRAFKDAAALAGCISIKETDNER